MCQLKKVPAGKEGWLALEIVHYDYQSAEAVSY